MSYFLRVPNLLIPLGIALAVGCSSTTDTSKPSQADGGDTLDGSATDSGDPADSAPDARVPLDLKAPVITMVAQMTGGLHVMWTNKQGDCDAIEGERKSATEPYAVVFTVPDGSVDNKHDTPLTKGTAYTYRLRCKKGVDYSPYSNEKSGTP